MKTQGKLNGGIPAQRQITALAGPVKTKAVPPQYTGTRSEAAKRMLQGKK